MIGIVIVTHGNIGESLIEVSASILGAQPENIISISIDLNKSGDKLREKIADGIKSVDQRDGVFILTDMFGGTPSNLSYSFLKEGSIEVLSGVNLPILLKAINARNKNKIDELIVKVEQFGKKSISLASEILKKN